MLFNPQTFIMKPNDHDYVKLVPCTKSMKTLLHASLDQKLTGQTSHVDYLFKNLRILQG